MDHQNLKVIPQKEIYRKEGTDHRERKEIPYNLRKRG